MREKGLHRRRKRKLEDLDCKCDDLGISFTGLNQLQQDFRTKIGKSRNRALSPEPNTAGKMAFVTDQNEKVIVNSE